MDFTTLRKSINEYKSLVNAINSLRLIWKNCLQFNEENSEISITAKALEKEGELLIEVSVLDDICFSFLIVRRIRLVLPLARSVVITR